MDEHAAPDPVDLFARATQHAETVMARVTSDQLAGPTPCSEWTVQTLIDHMVGGTGYLLAALAVVAARMMFVSTASASCGATPYRSRQARRMSQKC